jgi:N-acetylmuramoyl-L-alanine amidase
MAKRRRKKYSLKPRFYVILALFIVLLAVIIKLIVGLISGIDSSAVSATTAESNNILIAIDSGHDSQTDKGAIAAGGISEYQLNDAVAGALETELESRGYTVIQTRTLDSKDEQSLNERVLTINEAWPDLLVSIHHNANEDETVKGFTIIYNSQKMDAYDGQYVKYKNNTYKVTKEEDGYLYYQSGSREKRINTESNEGKYEVFDLAASTLVEESIDAANDIYEAMSTLSFISPLSEKKDNVIINQNLQILRQTHCVGLMVECGFMTNDEELSELTNEENQKEMAKSIADGIDAYFNIESN